MVDPFTVGLYVQVASGGAILALGAALLAVHPRKAYTTSFGAFLGVWGGLILSGNLAALALGDGDTVLARRWILLHVAFLVTVYLPLAYFAIRFTRPGAGPPRLAAAGGLLVPALAGALILNVDPNLMHAGFVGTGARALSDWGPAYPFYTALFSLTIYATVWRLNTYRKDATAWIERRRTTYLLGAFLLYELFEAPENLVLFTGQLLADDPAPASWSLFAGVAAIGLLVVGRVAVDLVRDADPDVPLGSKRRALLLAAPVAFGALSGASSLSGSVPTVTTLGVWRLAAVALLVYAILRFELFGVTSTAADWIGIAGAAGLAVATAVAGYLLLEAWLGSAALAFTAIQVLVLSGFAMLLVRRRDVLEDLVSRLKRSRASPKASPRALEVYEAELARTRAAGSSDADAGQLPAVREALGIREHEHAALSSVVHGDATETPPPVEPGELLAERYRLGEQIGVGARSIVHRATDTQASEEVAVKLLQAGEQPLEPATRRFLREARVARCLDHPNVVDVIDTGFGAGRPFLVLELAEAGSLASRLESAGMLDPAEAVRVLDGVLAGLVHLHDRGLVHGDITPRNILLEASGTARLGDLGTARRWRPDQTRAMDEAAPGGGTPLYMAPEQLDGQPPTPRSDLYAAGAILYECLTGDHYLGLGSPTVEEVHRAIKSQPVKPATHQTDVPEALLAICEQALGKHPEDRFGSAARMRKALLAAVDQGADG